MICVNCKRELPEGTQFCPFCGAPAQSAGAPAVNCKADPGTGGAAGQPSAAPRYVPQNPQSPYPQQGPYVQQRPGQAPQPPAYGYGTPAAPQFVPGGAPGQPPKKKARWVVLGIAAAFLVVTGVVLASVLSWYNAPAQKFDRAMKAEDYAAAGAQLDAMDFYDRLEAVEEFVELANDACWDYNTGGASYEETEDLLNMLYGCCPEPDLKNVLDDLEILRESKADFEAGESAENAGDYPEAILKYGRVVEEDILYDEAQEKSEGIRERYRDEILQKAEELAGKGEYEAAADILLESMDILTEDDEVSDLWEEYQDKAWEAEMDAKGFAPSGKYKTVEDFVNSDVMQSQLSGMMESMASAGMSIEITGQGNKLIYTFVYEDLYGVDQEFLGNALAEALESMSDTFESVAASLKEAVEVENPVVVVEYVTADGTVLCSREFAAP